MTINCLTDDQKLNENKKRTRGSKMKITSQIATENKLAANDLKFKIETNEHRTFRRDEKRYERKKERS